MELWKHMYPLEDCDDVVSAAGGDHPYEDFLYKDNIWVVWECGWVVEVVRVYVCGIGTPLTTQPVKSLSTIWLLMLYHS